MMKNQLALLFCMMAATYVGAQEVRLMGGFNTLQIGETGTDVSLTGGTGIQFEADAQFGQRLYVQPGIGYVMRNAVFTTISNQHAEAQLVESDYKSHALRLSLMGGYRLLDEFDRGSFNIRLFAGPSVLIGTSSRFENALVGNVPDNNAQLYITLGAGLERNIFFADVGYDFAMNDAFDLVGAEGRFNMLRVNLGIRLRFLGRDADTPTIIP